MDFINTRLTSADANSFFGVENNSFSLNSPVLEATLRYIAIVHCSDEIEKVKLIKVYRDTFNVGARGNDYANYIMSSSDDILIAESRNGAELPLIESDGWISLDTPPYPVAPFLSGASATAVYLNSDAHKVVIFVKKATEKWIDKLCSSLFRILSWLYTENYALTSGELELFKATHDRDSEKFTQVINELGGKFDFRSMISKRTLMGWNNHYKENQIKTFESKYATVQESISRKEAEIAALYSEADGYIFNLNNLRNQPDDNDDSLYQFFKTHKQLGIYKTSSNSSGKLLYYSIVDTIEYYDEDAFIRVRDNQNSYFYDRSFSDDVRAIMNGVFADGKGKIRVESMFTLTNLSSINVVRGVRSGNYQDTHIPHPHLYHHGCLGGNGSAISQYMRSGDWDLGIEQTIAATKNINFGDSTVVRGFMGDISRYMNSSKCIIADNGSEMTPKEFLEYIKTTNQTAEEVTNNG